jgi:hypothetical protein
MHTWVICWMSDSLSYMWDWLKQLAVSRFGFMIVVSGQISLEVFGVSADHDICQKIIEFEFLPSPWLSGGCDSTKSGWRNQLLIPWTNRFTFKFSHLSWMIYSMHVLCFWTLCTWQNEFLLFISSLEKLLTQKKDSVCFISNLSWL